jgi:hypothetical protein
MAKVGPSGASGGGQLAVPANAFIREDGVITAPPSSGGGSGTVTSVTATDTSIAVSGTDTVAPTIATGTLDVIATEHPPVASVPMNSQKFTGMANGAAATDSAAFGQLPSSTSPLALTAGGTGQDAASAAALLAALGAAAEAGVIFTGYVAPAASALIFGSSIAVNAALGNAFNLTLTASSGTLANPTNPAEAQIIRFRITQGTGGNFTLAYGNAYDFGAQGAPTLSTGVGKVDIVGFEYVASISKWCYLGPALGN